MFEEIRKVLSLTIIILIILFIFFIIKNEKEKAQLTKENIITNIQNENIKKNLQDKIEITKKIYLKNEQQNKKEQEKILLIKEKTKKNLNDLTSNKLINKINIEFSNFNK